MRRAAACLVAGLAVLSCGDDEPTGTSRGPEAVLGDYLDAVEHGDYQGAAELLASGDEPLAQRSDLAPLDVADTSVRELATGLAEYCRRGCLAATGIALDEATHRAIVTFGEPRGHPLERTFTVGETDDGRPYVRGLPPAGTGTLPRL